MEATPWRAVQQARNRKFADAIKMALQIPYPYWRVHTLLEIAEVAQQQGLKTFADTALTAAITHTAYVEGDYWKAVWHMKIGNFRAKRGENAAATVHFQTAMQLIEQSAEENEGANATKIAQLREMAQLMREVKDIDPSFKDIAARMLRRALVRCEKEEAVIKSEMLRDIAVEMDKWGMSVEAGALMERAFAIADSIEDERKFDYLTEIVRRASELSDKSVASALLMELQDKVLQIQDEWERSQIEQKLTEIRTAIQPSTAMDGALELGKPIAEM